MEREERGENERIAAAKAFLSEALRCDRRIEALLERARHYEEMATRITGRMGRMERSDAAYSRVEEGAVALADLSEALAREVERLTGRVREIEEAIDALPDARERDMLRWRYLNGWTWEHVAGALFVHVRQVYRMHDKALETVAARGFADRAEAAGL